MQAAPHAGHAKVKLEILGQTVDGRDVEMLSIDNGGPSEGKRVVWIIARQHPGVEGKMRGCVELAPKQSI